MSDRAVALHLYRHPNVAIRNKGYSALTLYY